MASPAATSAPNVASASKNGEKKNGNGTAAPATATEDLTESERGLLAVYKLLKEQAEALRAAKQQQLLAKGGGPAGLKREGSLTGKKRERADSPALSVSPSPSTSSLGAASTGPSSGAAVLNNGTAGALSDGSSRAGGVVLGKAPRVAKRPAIRGASGGGGGMGQQQPQASPSVGGFGGSREEEAGSRGGGGGGGNIRPRLNPSAANNTSRASLPTGQQASVDGFSIPKRQPQPQQHWDAPPIPRKPVAGEAGGSERKGVRGSATGLEAVPGKSLDRQVYSADFLLRGVPQEWDTSEASTSHAPCLVVDLPGFGDPDFDKSAKDTLALELTVPENSTRFTINVCKGPLDADQRLSLSPPDIVLHINPRKSYRRGTVTSKTKRAGSWVEEKPKFKPLSELPTVFSSSKENTTITLRIRMQPHKVTAYINEHEVCVHDMIAKPDDESPITTLSLHVPNEDVETHLLEHCIVHEVWWGHLESQPQPRGQAQKQAAVQQAAAQPQQPPQQEGMGRGGQQPALGGSSGRPQGPGLGGGTDFGKLLGALGGGGGLGAAGGGLFGGVAAGAAAAAAVPVVSVVQLPECAAPEDVDRVKQDLLSMFSAFGQGAKEVHFKEGSNRAFVVMANASDQEAACKGLDWIEYAGKKLRMAKSKKVF